jgi:hypothetical protein
MSNETNPIEQVETRTVREEPSPLVMTKTRTRKEDGRILIYYEFSQPGKAQDGEDAPPAVASKVKETRQPPA